MNLTFFDTFVLILPRRKHELLLEISQLKEEIAEISTEIGM
jgi:hypothetical protein